jgi:hypothetical protein
LCRLSRCHDDPGDVAGGRSDEAAVHETIQTWIVAMARASHFRPRQRRPRELTRATALVPFRTRRRPDPLDCQRSSGIMEATFMKVIRVVGVAACFCFS